jgi:hypothetical protein
VSAGSKLIGGAAARRVAKLYGDGKCFGCQTCKGLVSRSS